MEFQRNHSEKIRFQELIERRSLPSEFYLLPGFNYVDRMLFTGLLLQIFSHHVFAPLLNSGEGGHRYGELIDLIVF